MRVRTGRTHALAASLLVVGSLVLGLAAAPAASSATLFSDGFESGWSNWTRTAANGGAAYTTSAAASAGSYGLRLSATTQSGSVGYVRRTLASSVPDLAATADFRVRTEGVSGSNVPFFVLLRSDGSQVLRLYRQNATGGQVWASWNGTYQKTSAALALGKWARLGVRATIASGSADAVTVTMNGATVLSATGISLGDSWIRAVQLGQEVGAQAFTEDVDQVTLSTPDGATATAAPSATPAPTATPTPAPTATPTPAPTATPTPVGPSGQAMPIGDVVDASGQAWRQVFTDDFTANVPLGSWPSAVSSKWAAYPNTWHDTSGNGTYDCAKVCSQVNGMLDMFIHTENGTPYVAAPVAKIPGAIASKWGDLPSGRYVMRFRADSLHGYKTAWLLWPQSGVWPRDGEIDFPEGNLDGRISAFMHRQGGTSGSDQDAYSTSATYPTWHTAVIEWVAGSRCTFYLDGVRIGQSTSRVPNTPMHWVIQTETTLDGIMPASTVAGHVQLDWVAVYVPSN